MKVVSFFAGCGGLDLGFEKAGFDVIWANEFDSSIHKTYQYNHPNTILCKTDVRQLTANDIPDCDGFIGGPPCQSWSFGGKQLGLKDERGRLFLDYIRLVKEKHPKFFVIENVEGIISDKHFQTFLSFLKELESEGYNVYYKLLNAADFKIPQDRNRVFVVGFAKELNVSFEFPQPSSTEPITLKQAIGDITTPPNFYTDEEVKQSEDGLQNHDVYCGAYDAKFMARNRVRSWNEVSYTIQAQAKNCPLHPQAPKMVYIDSNHRAFVRGYEHLYRRLSVRECARIQSFPDNFHFVYTNILDGYKMVGNAVPPRLARHLAMSIKQALAPTLNNSSIVLVGYYKGDEQLTQIIENKLYYVRAGFRRGALQMPVGVKPRFVYLHYRKERHYFKVLDAEPTIMTADELKKIGFSPLGGIYLTFKISTNEITPHHKIEIKGVGVNRAIPYLLNLKR